jgi:4-hydroxy-2-oxoheptanedioate aldolase
MKFELPKNLFKQAILSGRSQIGLWCTLASPIAAETVAGSGFDWLLLDTEHTPTDVEALLGLMQAVSAYPVSAVVRPPINDAVAIKRYLDIGVQSLLIPYVQSAEEARAAVAAVRYPPAGIRGVSAVTRATKFGRIDGYAARAAEEICLLVQVETAQALAALDAILAVEGVDGVFIGPGDLAASLGHAGNPGHPEVKARIEEAILRIRAAGKPAGILTPDQAYARHCIGLGTLFTAVGVDTGILARETERLREALR